MSFLSRVSDILKRETPSHRPLASSLAEPPPLISVSMTIRHYEHIISPLRICCSPAMILCRLTRTFSWFDPHPERTNNEQVDSATLPDPQMIHQATVVSTVSSAPLQHKHTRDKFEHHQQKLKQASR